jgi:3-deoxy-manno-octulosonate cytidylyltransferase (CMP-KDO synthetase)
VTVVAVIPARWASSRFPGKPLALIAGRPMLAWVCDRARAASTVDEVLVATDDERVVALCSKLGVRCELTSPAHPTGTDRIAELIERAPADIYVNVQGDEPLLDPGGIDLVVRCLQGALSSGVDVATGYLEGATSDELASPSVVHLVPTQDGHVLSFSRAAVPFAFREEPPRTVHVGLYAFTGAALGRFRDRTPGPVERAESIELLRYLEHGDRIACVAIQPGSIGVDLPEDIARVESVLAGRAAGGSA